MTEQYRAFLKQLLAGVIKTYPAYRDAIVWLVLFQLTLIQIVIVSDLVNHQLGDIDSEFATVVGSYYNASGILIMIGLVWFLVYVVYKSITNTR